MKKFRDKKYKMQRVEKVLFIVDMNNGFVNFGAMANPEYNKLVPEQLKLIKKFKCEGGMVNFVMEGHMPDSSEFGKYPEHCILGTKEAELIPELKNEEVKDDLYSKTYYKNSINGMLNLELQDDIREMESVKEIVITGVCADLCIMDFARTLARFLDEHNRKVKIFVVRSAIDTYDSPDHNRQEWLEIAYKVMEQAGIIIVDDVEELEEKEKQLKLCA